MPGTFRCRLVTPTEPLFEGDATYAMVPAHDGLFGVMTGRSPLLAQLGMGEMTIRFADGAERSYYIEGGFAKMARDDLIVLAEAAEPADRIVESEARAELAAAEARTVSPDAPDKAKAADAIARQRQRARLRLTIAQRTKTAGG